MRSLSLLAAPALVWIFGSSATAPVGAVAKEPAPEEVGSRCSVDLAKPGMMKDIVSNALRRGLDVPPSDVQEFLRGAEKRYPSGAALLKAAAEQFKLDEAVLTAAVLEYEHCNCSHGSQDSTPSSWAPVDDATEFARDVTLHVVLHEMAHALVREFDLPVLGNEETMADAFATHYLTTYLPERAPSVLEARVHSLMIEAGDVPRSEWEVSGEHNSDARRAFQIAALALAADKEAYAPLATSLGMSESDVRKSRDYGSEIHRSWRRILQPLWMPEGTPSTEAGVTFEEGSDLFRELFAHGLDDELRTALRRFDWHSYVKISFQEGEGKAGWSRSKRMITVRGDYVRRFIRQGEVAQGE